MKAVIVETFNGEGYSEPEFKVVENRASTQTIKLIEDLRSPYREFVENQIDGHNKGDVILTYDNDEDQGSIHVMDLPDSQFYIIQVRPQVNEVKFWVKMPTMETALSTLKEHIVNDETFEWDEDDVEDYDGEDYFGSHGKEEFLYFKIVEG
tara:strand:- start:428 stop:880 length:453 start_codon:yes stop_codon:yes gene_type:complete